MTLIEQANLVSMIKWTDERTSSTILVSGVPYDTDRTYEKELRIWGMKVWSKSFHIKSVVSNAFLNNKPETIGFGTVKNKDT